MSKYDQGYFNIEASLAMKHTSSSLLTVEDSYSQLCIAALGSRGDDMFDINESNKN